MKREEEENKSTVQWEEGEGGLQGREQCEVSGTPGWMLVNAVHLFVF